MVSDLTDLERMCVCFNFVPLPALKSPLLLAEQRDRYHREGFLVCVTLFLPDEVSRFRSYFVGLLGKTPSRGGRSLLYWFTIH